MLMQPPGTLPHHRYRLNHTIDERPDIIIHRGHDEQTDQPILLATLRFTTNALKLDAQRIAQQLTSIHHPALLTPRDTWTTNETLSLVCNDPGGQDLERMLRARGSALPEQETLTQSMHLLDCIETLHQQTPPIYLGDPLPSDIWCHPQGTWHLLPFTLIRTNSTLPSPYRAPERVTPNSTPTTTSDTYAIGALLYHAVTGWLPPSNEQRQAGMHLPGPGLLNPALSALTEQALLRAMQPRPINRYQTAHELRIALAAAPQTAHARTVGTATEPPPSSIPPNLPTPPPEPETTPPFAPPPSAETPIPWAETPAPLSATSPPQPTTDLATTETPPHLNTNCLISLAIIVTLLLVATFIAGIIFLPGSPVRQLFSHTPAPNSAPTTAILSAPLTASADRLHWDTPIQNPHHPTQIDLNLRSVYLSAAQRAHPCSHPKRMRTM